MRAESDAQLMLTHESTETSEGIDKLLSLRYYARVHLAQSLLPLLSQSPHPRVISILAPKYGEWGFHLDDPGLKSHYGVLLNVSHASIMTTLTFQHLAERNPAVSFLHVFPGTIWTPSVAVADISPVVKWVLTWIVRPLLAFWLQSPEECGDRMMFLCLGSMVPSRAAAAAAAAGAEGGPDGEMGVIPLGEKHSVLRGADDVVGSGCYCVDSGATRVGNSSRMQRLMNAGAREQVWRHTADVIGQGSSLPE